MPFYTEKHQNQLYYEDIGEGLPIVWIHPPGMGRKVFLQQHDLSDHYRVILPDLSGHGDSETVTPAPDISYYANEIIQLLDYLELPEVVVAGYSAGGSVAQELALTYPARVKALILAGGFPKVDTFGLRLEFLAGLEWVKKSPETLAKLLSDSHFGDYDIKRALNEHMAKSNPYIWYEFYKQALHFDCSGRLYQLSMPLLLMYGERSVWINGHAEYYRQCPDATLSIIDGAYHQIPASHGEVVNQLVRDFIKRKHIQY